MKIKLKTLVLNGIHQTFNNAILPIMVTTFFDIKSKAENKSSFVNFIPSIMIVLVFLSYPILTYLYLKKYFMRLVHKNRFADFQALHMSATQNLKVSMNKNSLFILIIIHFRRIFYSALIVFLSDLSFMQIILLQYISIALVILIM